MDFFLSYLEYVGVNFLPYKRNFMPEVNYERKSVV